MPRVHSIVLIRITFHLIGICLNNIHWVRLHELCSVKENESGKEWKNHGISYSSIRSHGNKKIKCYCGREMRWNLVRLQGQSIFNGIYSTGMGYNVKGICNLTNLHCFWKMSEWMFFECIKIIIVKSEQKSLQTSSFIEIHFKTVKCLNILTLLISYHFILFYLPSNLYSRLRNVQNRTL